MAWGCALVAWISAALWVGAVSVENILAVNQGDRRRLLKAGSEFPQLASFALRRLRWLQLAFALLICDALGTATLLVDQPTWFDATALLCAGAAALLLVFHVEQPDTASYEGAPPKVSWRLLHGALALGALSATSWSLSATALMRQSWITWAFSVGSGALIGAILLSAILLIALNRLIAVQRELSLAVVAARWTTQMLALTIVLAIPTLSVLPLLWNFSLPLALAASVGLVIALGALIALRFRWLGELWARLEALPVAGQFDRRLRSRTLQWKRAARAVIWGGATSGILLLALAAPVATFAAWPAYRAGPWQAALGFLPNRFAPTPTPTLAPNKSAQLHNQDGVQITFSVSHAHTGANAARITITDAQGKALPKAHVTIIANQALVNAGGVALDATPDPDGQPSDFAATLTFAQPGAWQVVVFVATADQSVSASTIFTVNVPA